MQQLIIKKNLDRSKIEALLNFLKSWDIDAEIKSLPNLSSKKKSDFSLSVGIWNDYEMDGQELRKQAWNRNL